MGEYDFASYNCCARRRSVLTNSEVVNFRLLAAHICFVFCFIAAVQNVCIPMTFLITCNAREALQKLAKLSRQEETSLSRVSIVSVVLFTCKYERISFYPLSCLNYSQN